MTSGEHNMGRVVSAQLYLQLLFANSAAEAGSFLGSSWRLIRALPNKFWIWTQASVCSAAAFVSKNAAVCSAVSKHQNCSYSILAPRNAGITCV